MVESEYFISDTALNLSGDNHLSKILVFLKNNPEMVLEKGDMEMFNRLCTILEFKRFPTPDDDFWGQVELVNKISSGVKVLSSYELELSNIMVNTFITHPYTSSIFNPELGVETLNQVVVTTQIDGIPCKILIDKLLVNHNTKQLFVYDIKTGSPSSDFIKNFFGYKYYYQGSFYYTVLKQFLLSIPELSEYSIIDGFNFIYVSREDPYRPFIYNMDTNYIQYVYNGYETISGMKIKGIKELLDDYSWYKTNEIYDTIREIYEK